MVGGRTLGRSLAKYIRCLTFTVLLCSNTRGRTWKETQNQPRLSSDTENSFFERETFVCHNKPAKWAPLLPSLCHLHVRRDRLCREAPSPHGVFCKLETHIDRDPAVQVSSAEEQGDQEVKRPVQVRQHRSYWRVRPVLKPKPVCAPFFYQGWRRIPTRWPAGV